MNVNNVYTRIFTRASPRTILNAYRSNSMHDFHVMLDSGANCGIFKNAQLLTNLKETDCTVTISGIGGKLTTNIVGMFNGTSEVFYHAEAIANILSQSQERDNGATITYNSEQDNYAVSYAGYNTLLSLETVSRPLGH